MEEGGEELEEVRRGEEEEEEEEDGEEELFREIYYAECSTCSCNSIAWLRRELKRIEMITMASGVIVARAGGTGLYGHGVGSVDFIILP